MEYFRFGTVHYFIAFVFEAPAQVNFFHVGKKTVVKAAGLVPAMFFYKHCGAGCPKHFARLLILTGIFLSLIKHSSAAKHIAIAIDETARGSRMFKIVPLDERSDFWRRRGDQRIAFH